MGFSEEARNAIYRSVQFNEARQSADWLHINSANYLGPNKWYDAGDQRFHPDNIMISSRNASFIGIIAIFSNSKGRANKAFKFRITNLLVLSFAPGFISLFIIWVFPPS